MTLHNDAQPEDIRTHQHAVLRTVIATAEGPGRYATVQEMQRGLRMAGLPEPSNTEELESLMNGVHMQSDPLQAFTVALQLFDLRKLAATAPGWHEGMTLDEALAALGITHEQAMAHCHKCALERVVVKDN